MNLIRSARTFGATYRTPNRDAALVAASLGLLVAGGVSARRVAVRTGLLSIAVSLGVGLHLRTTANSREALLNEVRNLWALSGSMFGDPPWPVPGGWALGGDAINAMVREINRRGLKTIVELGPGTSSIIIGRACGDACEMYGLEHDERFAQATRAALDAHGVGNYTLVMAPLRPLSDEASAPIWYESEALDHLPRAIDALIVDGPPNWSSTGNREPAWSLVSERMSPGSVVLVDDTQRPDERAMVERWVESGDLTVLLDAGSFILLEVAARD